MRKNKVWIFIFLLPSVIIFLSVYAASLLILFSSSFTEWRVGAEINFIGFKHYYDMFFNDVDFKKCLLNTVIWIVLQSTVHVFIGVVFALILAKKQFYWKFARTVYMIPNIISTAAMGMLFVCILNPEFGLVNNCIRLLGFKNFYQNWFMDYSTAFLVVTMTWLPYAAVVSILVLAEISAIPESLIEAARIDGATELELNIHIIIPMLRNIIGTCVIIAGTSMLQNLDRIMMTTGGGPGNETLNLPMYIYRTALIDNNFGYANTVGVFLVMLGIALILTIQRLFRIGTSEV